MRGTLADSYAASICRIDNGCQSYISEAASDTASDSFRGSFMGFSG